MSGLSLREVVHALYSNLHRAGIDLSNGQKIPLQSIRELVVEIAKDSGYGFEDVKQYLKKRGLAHFKGNRHTGSLLVFVPTFVGETANGTTIVFINRHKSEEVSFVCEICERGFASATLGLGDHLLRAPKHKAHVQHEVDRIIIIEAAGEDTEYGCPMPYCDYVSVSKADVERHLGQKIKKVNLKTMEVQSIGDPSLYYCEICDMRLPAGRKDRHDASKKHRLNLLDSNYFMDKTRRMEDKEGVEILVNNERAQAGTTINMGGNASVKVNFTIRNVSGVSVTLNGCHSLFDLPDVILSDQLSISGGNGAACVIPATGRYVVEMDYKPSYAGKVVVPIIFKFTRNAYNMFEILREVAMENVSNPVIFQLLQPTAPYKKAQRDPADRRLQIVESDFLPEFEKADNSLVIARPLEKYRIPLNIKILLGTPAVKEDVLRELNLNDLSFNNYSEFFNNLLYLEEHQMVIDIRFYTIESAAMRKDSRSGLLWLNVPGLAENRPSVLRGDKLYAIPSKSDGKKYQGHVHNVTLTEVALGFPRGMRDAFFQGLRYKIEFTVNRLTLMVAHRAVSWAGESAYCLLKDVLFPTSIITRPVMVDPATVKLTFKAKEINDEQQTAVKHILCGTSRPAPYLIYGPPGTGKTFTLVEAIKQVYDHSPANRILACAPQNAAADLITKRLIGHVDKQHILRIHALSRTWNDVEESIRGVSNYRSNTSKVTYRGADQEVWYPSKEELAKYRVIVVTLVTSGRLVSAEMGSHFTHIFIDEAGHATEPETVIPLAGLLDVNMKNGGQVVLAGDPKQLGPVIRSPLATERLGVSLLERLMDRDVYSRQQPYNRYNSDYVTKLVRSFRSHQDILKVPNDCFYEGELQVWADIVKRERFCNWEGLPKKGFPLIFHGVNGKEDREESSPSWFNAHEADVVQDYVRQLMECRSPSVSYKDVGIISPYHKQVNKIKQAMKALDDQLARRRQLPDIKVGSVEKFQGDEREVIIISTVRSQDKHLTDDKKFNLGFVNNAKRFNVAVTRAKALLIIVGNPAVLATDDNWKRLIRHIRDGGGYTGCPLPADFDSDGAEDLTQQFSAVSLQENDDCRLEMLDLNEMSTHQQLFDPDWQRKDA